MKNVLNTLQAPASRRFEYRAPDEAPADSRNILTNYQDERESNGRRQIARQFFTRSSTHEFVSLTVGRLAVSMKRFVAFDPSRSFALRAALP